MTALAAQGDAAAAAHGHGDNESAAVPGVTTFMGYRRGDGRAGVRNHVVVLSAVQCANGVVRRIAQLVPEVVPITHVYGCGQLGDDHRQTQRVLEEFAQHPNVGAVLLVGLGCETLPTTEIGERLAAGGTAIRRLTIQEAGGSRSTVERGVEIARELLAEAGRASSASRSRYRNWWWGWSAAGRMRGRGSRRTRRWARRAIWWWRRAGR